MQISVPSALALVYVPLPISFVPASLPGQVVGIAVDAEGRVGEWCASERVSFALAPSVVCLDAECDALAANAIPARQARGVTTHAKSDLFMTVF